MPVLETIPITQLLVSGKNPRGKVDESSEAFKGLRRSIKDRGVFEPIVVGRPDDKKRYTIIDGHRRHAAATKEKVAEIPAMVLDSEGFDLVAALITNIQREDFPPVSEATAIKEMQDGLGFTQVQAGDVLGKSERWVRERLRLLKLPAKTKEAYDAGALPLESLVAVEKLAKQAPKAAEALAEAASADKDVRSAVGREAIGDAFEIIEHDKAKIDVGCLLRVKSHGGQVDLKSLARCGATKEQLDAAKNAIAETKTAGATWTKAGGYFNSRDADEVRIHPADIEEAKSFGCLLEVNGATYITDVAWLADRFIELHNRVQQSLRDRLKSRGSRVSTKSSSSEKPKSDAAKEQAKRERIEENERRDRVRANNLELGQRAQKAYDKPKLSLEEEKLVALMMVGKNAPDLSHRGLIYCYRDFQEEEPLKNGGTRVSYSPKRDAGQQLLEEIMSAKRPGEPIALALRSTVLAGLADQTCVAPSARSYFGLSQVASEEIAGLVDSIADTRGLLPEAVKADREKAKAIAVERAELVLLLEVKRAGKATRKRDALLQLSAITAELIDAAVGRRHLKEKDVGDTVGYTITGPGIKRLEKLKAAEKEREAAA